MKLSEQVAAQLSGLHISDEIEEYGTQVEIICVLMTLATHAKRRPLTERQMKEVIGQAKKAMGLVDYVTIAGDHVVRKLPKDSEWQPSTPQEIDQAREALAAIEDYADSCFRFRTELEEGMKKAARQTTAIRKKSPKG